MTDPTLASLQAEIDELKVSVPTLEELLLTVTFQCWVSESGGTPTMSRASGFRMCLLTAPIPIKVLSVSVCWEYLNLPASDTSYWTGTLEIGTGPAGFPDVAQRSTRNTGATANGGVTARKPWTFDAAAWADSDMAAGEVLALNWSKTGGPANLSFPMIATVRYAAL